MIAAYAVFSGVHDPLLHGNVKVHYVVGQANRVRSGRSPMACRIDDRFCNKSTGCIGELFIIFRAVTVFMQGNTWQIESRRN